MLNTPALNDGAQYICVESVLMLQVWTCRDNAVKPARKENKIEDSAGSYDTASMIKGKGYLGARTKYSPTAQTILKKLLWVRGGKVP